MIGAGEKFPGSLSNRKGVSGGFFGPLRLYQGGHAPPGASSLRGPLCPKGGSVGAVDLGRHGWGMGGEVLPSSFMFWVPRCGCFRSASNPFSLVGKRLMLLIYLWRPSWVYDVERCGQSSREFGMPRKQKP